LSFLFLWGILAFPEKNPIKNYYLTFTGLLFLILGIIGTSLSRTDKIRNIGKPKETGRSAPALDISQGAKSPLLASVQGVENRPNPLHAIFGVLCALTLGVLNGSMMVPLNYAPKSSQGINYIVPFSIGVLLVTPVFSILYFLIIRKIPQFHIRYALLPGMITGLLWQVGNFCSIYATLYLGLAIVFPLTQIALVVSGLWGIIAFKELSGTIPILTWAFSVLIILGGAVLLALYA